MTSLCMDSVGIPLVQDRGRSQEARRVKELIIDTEYSSARSITAVNYHNRLWELVNFAVHQRIVEYGSKTLPINLDSYYCSFKFVDMLPTILPAPNIYIESDNMVEFEWYINPCRLFTVTIEGSNKLIFAGLFDEGSSVYGTERFEHEIPKSIIDNIQRLYSRS